MFKGKTLIGLGLVIAIAAIGGFIAMSMRDQGPAQADVMRVVNEELQGGYPHWQVRSLNVTSSETVERFGATVYVREFTADVEVHEQRYAFGGQTDEFIFARISVEQGRSDTLTGTAEIVRHEGDWFGRAEFADFSGLPSGRTEAELIRSYGGRNSVIVRIGTPEEAEVRRTLAERVEAVSEMIAGEWVGSTQCGRASADREYEITLERSETAGAFTGTASFAPGPQNERGAPGSFTITAEYRRQSGWASPETLQIDHENWIDRPGNAGPPIFLLAPEDGTLTGRAGVRNRGSMCDIVLTRP